MKKLALAITLSLSALSLSAPQVALAKSVHKPAAARSAPATPAVRPALWKLADKDTTIWLFGTIHALPKGIKWLDGPIAKAFDSSDVLVTEIPESPPELLQGAVMKLALLPKDQTLHGLMPKADAALMDKTLGEYGVPPAALDKYEPWFAALNMVQFPLMKGGYSAADGVEAQLTARAKAKGHPQEGLETVEYQLGLFDSLPQKTQLTYLHGVLINLPKMSSELDNLVKYWSAGNPAKLAALMNADEDDPKLMEVLLTNRNRNWAKWIKARMAKPGSVFIAVGAGHLAGAQSVQAQLAKSGFRVTRVQ